MLFVSSGMLAYYSQLFHFEHYPELVSPAEMVNISKWIHVPYRLAKTMMPTSFADRFRLHDDHFLQTLLKGSREKLEYAKKILKAICTKYVGSITTFCKIVFEYNFRGVE